MLKQLSEKERGYIFGLFEGDGYKYHDKKSRHYHVEFYLNSIRDRAIIMNLISLLKKAGLNPSEYLDKRYNCKRIRVYNKEFFEIISKKLDISACSNEFNMGYVSGIIDSEGYVDSKRHYIVIVNTNRNMLYLCKDFLSKIGINSSINQRKKGIKDTLNAYRMYISVKFKRLNHISIKVEIGKL